MTDIVLLISVPDGGLALFRHCVACARRTASGPVAVYATFQNEQAVRDIADLAIHVERVPPNYFHSNSATHSRCINALYEAAMLASPAPAVGIICDYDTAIVRRDWDRVLLSRMESVDLLGSPYASDLAFGMQTHAGQFQAMKYQRMPNAIWMAYRRATLARYTPDARICDFADRYHEGAVPVKLISTNEEAALYGLPVGGFLHVDTGTRVPELIHRNGVRAACFERRVDDYAVVRRPETDWPAVLRPEEYWLDGEPFVVHFRKGSSKTTESIDAMRYGPEEFVADIAAYTGRP